jgi:ATP/maltotriose-dependent transcriptional regulator MalT
VVIEAPAGYGKTVLAEQISDFATTDGHSVAWVQVSASTAEPDLLESIRRAQPELAGSDVWTAIVRTSPWS